MIFLQFDKKISFKIYPYTQCNKYPNVILHERNVLNKKLTELNTIILDRTLLATEVEKNCKSCIDAYKKIISPFYGTFIGKVMYKLTNGLITKKQLLKLRNSIMCEAHLEKIRCSLDNLK